MSSFDIYNLYRSIYSFKNILLQLDGIGEIKITELSTFGKSADVDTAKLKPGDFVFSKKQHRLLIYCVDDNFIEIKKLTLVDKKKVMTGVDLHNGYLKKLKFCLQV